MAYVADNLAMVYQTMGAQGSLPRHFVYSTVSDSDATITGAGYFADGVTKGLRLGDTVTCYASTGPKFKTYQVTTVSGAAATVSTPTAIT